MVDVICGPLGSASLVQRRSAGIRRDEIQRQMAMSYKQNLLTSVNDYLLAQASVPFTPFMPPMLPPAKRRKRK